MLNSALALGGYGLCSLASGELVRSLAPEDRVQVVARLSASHHKDQGGMGLEQQDDDGDTTEPGVGSATWLLHVARLLRRIGQGLVLGPLEASRFCNSISTRTSPGK